MDRQNGSSLRRRQEFKKGADLEESRRRRGDDIVQQRKNKREENLQKKRVTALDSIGATPQADTLNASATIVQTVFVDRPFDFIVNVLVGGNAEHGRWVLERKSTRTIRSHTEIQKNTFDW